LANSEEEDFVGAFGASLSAIPLAKAQRNAKDAKGRGEGKREEKGA